MTLPPVRVFPLSEFISEKGRLSAAKLLGCTGPALANALKAGRTIFVALGDNGTATAVEISSFPGRQPRSAGQSALVGFFSEILHVFRKHWLDEQYCRGGAITFCTSSFVPKSNAGPVQGLPVLGVNRSDEFQMTERQYPYLLSG